MGLDNMGENIFRPEDEGRMKVVGKIDLSQFDRKSGKPGLPAEKHETREGYNEILNAKLKLKSEKINDQFGYFLNSDGSIAMDSPDYKFSDKAADQSYIEDLEFKFAANSNKSWEEWTRDREKASGIITEKALVLFLDKVLGDDFIVARTAALDDYRHGMDTVIIDKSTGTPICGVDEMGADDAQSYNKKGQKIYNIIEHNGAYVKYGATFRHGELQRKSIKNVPAFYLSLDEVDLDKVLSGIESDEVSEAEINVFQRLLNSFDLQISTLYKDHINLAENPFAVKNKLLLEQEDLKDIYGDREWSGTDEGRNWKNRMGRNNMRLNLLNFQKSLAQMKETYKKIKNS